MKDNFIPIFFACDDNFINYLLVALTSLYQNADKRRAYSVYILHTGITRNSEALFEHFKSERFKISFVDVGQYFDLFGEKLPIRDYYSCTTYYRLIIADMFSELDKAIYIDCDTIVSGDISKLYDTELGDAYLAAAHEQVVIQTDVYGTYVEQVIGINRKLYFNAGVLLINCRAFREKNLLTRFSELLKQYTFTVIQDQDYLNVICKDHVRWLEQKWNCEVFGEIPCRREDACIVHYVMTSKPWHYDDCRWSDLFWHYAEQTEVYPKIREVLLSFSADEKAKDARSCQRLAETARKEIAREDNYLKNLRRSQNAERVKILEKIQRFELEGKFDIDVEDDPPAPPLPPEKIDYVSSNPIKRVKTAFAFATANTFVHRLCRKKKMIIKDIIGAENFQNLRSGAVITCNHFNAFDSFAIQQAYYASKQKKRKFYRVIREGNYTGFPGFYGFLMRNCRTLPLSSNMKTMSKFLKGIRELLLQGHFILFYPEQSMWWNYRKPKPLKAGAFSIAAKNNVPVLPCFITMQDSGILGSDGFYVQEYTIHIGKAIYPDLSLSTHDRINEMCGKNYAVWKEIYETTYGLPLSYITKTDESPAVFEESLAAGL